MFDLWTVKRGSPVPRLGRGSDEGGHDLSDKEAVPRQAAFPRGPRPGWVSVEPLPTPFEDCVQTVFCTLLLTCVWFYYYGFVCVCFRNSSTQFLSSMSSQYFVHYFWPVSGFITMGLSVCILGSPPHTFWALCPVSMLYTTIDLCLVYYFSVCVSDLWQELISGCLQHVEQNIQVSVSTVC